MVVLHFLLLAFYFIIDGFDMILLRMLNLLFTLLAQDGHLDLSEKGGLDQFFGVEVTHVASVDFSGEIKLEERQLIGIKSLFPDEVFLTSEELKRELELTDEQVDEVKSILQEITEFKSGFMARVRNGKTDLKMLQDEFTTKAANLSDRWNKLLLPIQADWMRQIRNLCALRQLGLFEYTRLTCEQNKDFDWSSLKPKVNEKLKELRADHPKRLKKIEEEFFDDCSQGFDSRLKDWFDVQLDKMGGFNDIVISEAKFRLEELFDSESNSSSNRSKVRANKNRLLDRVAAKSLYVWKSDGFSNWVRAKEVDDITGHTYRFIRFIEFLDNSSPDFLDEHQKQLLTDLNQQLNQSLDHHNRQMKLASRSEIPDKKALRLRIQDESNERDENVAKKIEAMLSFQQKDLASSKLDWLQTRQTGLISWLLDRKNSDKHIDEKSFEQFVSDVKVSIENLENKFVELEKEYIQSIAECMGEKKPLFLSNLPKSPRAFVPSMSHFELLLRGRR